MKKNDVINHFGGVSALSKALHISSVAIYKWPDPIPKVRAYELERITNGALRFDESLYSKTKAAA